MSAKGTQYLKQCWINKSPKDKTIGGEGAGQNYVQMEPYLHCNKPC